MCVCVCCALGMVVWVTDPLLFVVAVLRTDSCCHLVLLLWSFWEGMMFLIDTTSCLFVDFCCGRVQFIVIRFFFLSCAHPGQCMVDRCNRQCAGYCIGLLQLLSIAYCNYCRPIALDSVCSIDAIYNVLGTVLAY